MSGYIGTQPVPQATQKRQAFTATNGQTSFATSGYSVGFVDVYMNGVKLAAADYTATNGSDVVLSSGALVNDIVEIVAFTSFVASGGLPTTGGTVTGDITFNDSIKSKFGTGADLQVFHNGTDAKINNDTGHLDLSNTTAGSSIRILGSGESLAEFSDDGDVDLFHNGALKFSTTATGVAVTGTVSTTGKVALPATVGTAGQLLQVNAGASAAAWATVTSAYSPPTIPNWANPTNTYTSSGTWSKGSLADDAVVWIYLVGGGSGGWTAPDPVDFGAGGFCRIIVGTAKDFNGGAYVVGAGGSAAASGGNSNKGGNGGNTTFTQASGVGTRVFTGYGGLGAGNPANQSNDLIKGGGAEQVFGSLNDAYIRITGDGSVITAKLGVDNVFLNLASASTSSVQTSVFNGGSLATMNTVNNTYVRTSLFGGNAGVSQFLSSGGTTTSTTAGSVPGGMGGCGRVSGSFSGAQAKAGGAGNVRVYHV